MLILMRRNPCSTINKHIVFKFSQFRARGEVTVLYSEKFYSLKFEHIFFEHIEKLTICVDNRYLSECFHVDVFLC